MSNEKQHWSERAKRANASAFPPPTLSRRNEPPTPKSKAEFMLAGIGIVLLAAVVGAAVIFISRGEGTTSAPEGSVATPTTRVTEATPVLSSATGSGTVVQPPMALYEEPISGFSFEYPASWVEFPSEGVLSARNPLPGTIGLGDPEAPGFGLVPSTSVAFEPLLLTKEELSETAVAGLERAAAYWRSQAGEEYALEVVEPVTGFRVNGLDAAHIAYRLTAQGRPMRMSVYFALSDTYGCVLVLYTEEKDLERNRPLFDRMIASLRVEDVN